MITSDDISNQIESDALEVLLIDSFGYIIGLSPRAANYFNRPQHELQGRSLNEVFSVGIQPAISWLNHLSKAGSALPPLFLNLEHAQVDTAVIHIEGILYAIEVGSRPRGETVAGLAIRPSTDVVTQGELISAQRQILDLVAQRSTLISTLESVAVFAEKILPSEVFCMLMPVSKQGVVGEGLCASLPADIRGILAQYKNSPDAAPGLVAKNTGQMVFANGVELDPRWSAYSDQLRGHGLVAVWSVPIFDSRASVVRALLEFHLPVRRGPTRGELQMVEELTQLARLAIDLHQVQSDLDTSESSLRSTVQTIPLLLWQTDAEGRFTECQGKALDSLGLRVGEVVGHLVEDIFSSDSRAKLYHDRAFAGENVSGEISVGMSQFIQSVVPLRNEAGAIIGARGVALDVTAQRLAEESAQEKGDLLKIVIDTALDAVVTIDVHGKIILWNKQAESLFGWTSEEVRGKRLEETIIPQSLVKAHQEGMRRYNAEGLGPILGKRTETSAINRQGKIFPVELTVNPHKGKYVGGFSAFIRDISDIRRKDAAKRAIDERYKLVIEASSDGFWDYQLEGGESVVSPRCWTMLGYEVGQTQLSTPDVNPLIHPEDAPLVKELWQTHLAGKSAHYESQHRRRASDGSWRWILDRGRVVERINGDKALRVSGTQTDITERRVMEANLGAAQRMESLGALASGFAKELESVLSVIRAQALLTNITSDLPTKAVESLGIIQLQVWRAMTMSRNLILLGEGGGVGESSPKIQVSDAVNAAVRLLAPNLPRTISVVVEDLTDGREYVAIDSSRLQQAILNMLMRSIEALANSGLITLRITQFVDGGESSIRVECIDKGEPLSALQLEHAFNPLASDGSLRGRTAMGLAAVKRFAQAAGGHATIANTQEGIVLCLSIPTMTEIASQDRLPIVLFKNHPLMRPMLVEALQASGHRVIAIEHEKELVAAAKRAGAQCILILDQASISAPLDDVLDAIKAGLKSMPPVILLVGGAEKNTQVHMPVVRLQKPFMLDSLFTVIAQLSVAAQSKR